MEHAQLIEFVWQNILWVALFVSSGVLLAWGAIRGDNGDGMSPQEAVTLINREGGIVVDVRKAADFSAGHLAGARHIPSAQFAERAAELEKFKNRPIVVYGNGGDASRAVKLLRQQGYAKADSLAGGYTAWADAGMPTQN
ncbi:MAG TPA: rhodanese-like domain-containing protein [Rhodocyclaceae bacterium]|jgi:rhodanese-related sulfurtransferase|nr:rhodanese-like domain-containing protein [Rhodocyclaceae bacterium]